MKLATGDLLPVRHDRRRGDLRSWRDVEHALTEGLPAGAGGGA